MSDEKSFELTISPPLSTSMTISFVFKGVMKSFRRKRNSTVIKDKIKRETTKKLEQGKSYWKHLRLKVPKGHRAGLCRSRNT